MRAGLLVLGSIALLAACKPSPDSFRLAPRSGLVPNPGGGSGTMVEGDVFVMDAVPLDDGDDMDLCVTATSSNSGVVEVRRVTGKCRLFIVSAKGSGSATLTFSARDGSQTFKVTATPLPP